MKAPVFIVVKKDTTEGTFPACLPAPGHSRPDVCFSPSGHSCQGTAAEGTRSCTVSPLSRKERESTWDPWIKERLFVPVACSELVVRSQAAGGAAHQEGSGLGCWAEPAQSLEKDLELLALFPLVGA